MCETPAHWWCWRQVIVHARRDNVAVGGTHQAVRFSGQEFGGRTRGERTLGVGHFNPNHRALA